MHKQVTMAVLVAALAACSERNAPPANDTGAAEAEAARQAIREMPEGQRNAVFIRAIQDAREPCQHVERSELSGENQNGPVWTAFCQGGGEYRIVIGEGGMASVLAIGTGDQVVNQVQ